MHGSVHEAFSIADHSFRSLFEDHKVLAHAAVTIPEMDRRVVVRSRSGDVETFIDAVHCANDLHRLATALDDFEDPFLRIAGEVLTEEVAVLVRFFLYLETEFGFDRCKGESGCRSTDGAELLIRLRRTVPLNQLAAIVKRMIFDIETLAAVSRYKRIDSATLYGLNDGTIAESRVSKYIHVAVLFDLIACFESREGRERTEENDSCAEHLRLHRKLLMLCKGDNTVGVAIKSDPLGSDLRLARNPLKKPIALGSFSEAGII